MSIQTNHEPKYRTLLMMIYVVVLLAAVDNCMYVAKIGGFVFTEGAAIIPFMYMIGDVIAEVYGYQVAKRMIWYALFCEVIFIVIVVGMVHLPSPTYWHKQYEYRDVLGSLYRVLIATLLILPLTAFTNTFALCKLKVLIKGKFFWLRSLTSNMIGELTLAICGNVIVFFGTLSARHLATIIVASFLMKLVFSIVFVMPIALLVNTLKKSEGIDTYDHNIIFNPFKSVTNE